MPSATEAEEAEHHRHRVIRYFSVMLVIDVFAYVSDGVNLLLGKPTPEMPFELHVVRFGATALMLAAWTIAKFLRPRRPVTVALEGLASLALALVYAVLGNGYLKDSMPLYAPVFPLLGLVLLLSVRAALVPSLAIRTALIGAAAILIWYITAYAELQALPYVAREGLVFIGGAATIATAVTSRVIYGLQREVRDAKRMGQYELVSKLGEGGMGVVYRATHMMLRRPTAIKILPTDKAGEQTVARFEREVKQTSRLEHPNSVFIYDYGRTPEGQFYYAMEYLDGVTLAQLIADRGPISQSRVVSILSQAANALAEAHRLGLVHRDIKPANIMLCERAGVPDTVKVLDFGLVKTVDSTELDAHITHDATIVGTPHYLAPESISTPNEVGPAADIYALGAIGFFLLTGRDVFLGKSVIEVCSKHLEKTPQAPGTLSPHPISEELESLILRCLSKSPSDRPVDGDALAAELSALNLQSWSTADATAWWSKYNQTRSKKRSDAALERTQLAIDIQGRA